MIGRVTPRSRRPRCSSSPLDPGSRTSRTRQPGVSECRVFRNSWAEPKVRTSRRTDRTRLAIPSRTDTSSSTTNTTGCGSPMPRPRLRWLRLDSRAWIRLGPLLPFGATGAAPAPSPGRSQEAGSGGGRGCGRVAQDGVHADLLRGGEACLKQLIHRAGALLACEGRVRLDRCLPTLEETDAIAPGIVGLVELFQTVGRLLPEA